MAVSIIIVLFLLFVEIFGVKYIKESQNVLNYQFTKILKGVCCFPVIFSHIYACMIIRKLIITYFLSFNIVVQYNSDTMDF